MEPGTQIVHNQLGKGVVVFDKPHCLQVNFILYGKWNFTQEEWASGKVAPERLRGLQSFGEQGESDLEYSLQAAVDSGDLTEEAALQLYHKKIHPLEARKYRKTDLNDTFERFRASPDDEVSKELLGYALLQFITALVRKQAFHSRSTYSNIEDAIQDSALEVWERLPDFDRTRSSFRRWVSLITMHNITDLLRKVRTSRGKPNQPDADAPEEPNPLVLLEEEDVPTSALPADKQILLKEFIQGLTPEDRSVVQMTIDGLTTREIAEALGISAMTVSRRLKYLRNVTKPPF